MNDGAALADSDLKLAFDLVQGWESFRQKRIFLTGGTGFFGRWCLETLLYANSHLKLGMTVTVLTRSHARWRASVPHLADAAAVHIIEGDVRDFTLPRTPFDWVLHGAGPVRRNALAAAPAEIYDQIVEGTRRVLEFARRVGASRFLMVSSGAVYGRQPLDLAGIAEDYLDTLTGVNDPYSEGKKAAEALCSKLGKDVTFTPVVARCFSFVGPGLPLDDRFAIGNFIADVKAGRVVRVLGSGADVRSYLYSAEMAAWLWTLLAQGTPGRAYNVGSGDGLTTRAIAEIVAKKGGGQGRIEVMGGPTVSVSRYVPDISRIGRELGLSPRVPLAEAVARTLEWNTVNL